MPNIPPAGRLAFDGPAAYRIRVQGRLPARWSGGLEGMTVTVADPGEASSDTTLEGELVDQASLAGVLNALYDLRLPVLSVECLRSTGGDQGM